MSIRYENVPRRNVWTIHLIGSPTFSEGVELEESLQTALEAWNSPKTFRFPYGKLLASVKQIGHVINSAAKGNLNLKLYSTLNRNGRLVGYVVRNYHTDYNVPILQVRPRTNVPFRYGYHAHRGHTPKTRYKGFGTFDWEQSQAIYDWLTEERYYHDVVMAFGNANDGTLEFTVFKHPHDFPLEYADNYDMNSPEPDELRIFQLTQPMECQICGASKNLKLDPNFNLIFCGKACQITMYRAIYQ